MGILRLILALSVVAAHCGGYRFVGGQIAVQSFFIISGFYMSLILNEKYIGKNSSYQLFITNRYIRLYPIYWTVLLLTALVSLAIGITSDGYSFLKFDSYLAFKTSAFTLAYLILTNIIIFGQDIVLFLGLNPSNGQLFFTSNFQNSHPQLYSFLLIPQAWTLGLELTFYLIAPFILRKGVKIIGFIIVASFLFRLFLYNHLGFTNDPWTYRFFPTEIMFFLLGHLSYRLHLRYHQIVISRFYSLAVFFLVILFTTVYNYLPTTTIAHSPFLFKEYFYFTTITLALPILFNFFKKNGIDRQLGELSYPIYISHMLVALALGLTSSKYLHSGLAVTVTTIVFSYFLNTVIATPIEKYRQSRLRR